MIELLTRPSKMFWAVASLLVLSTLLGGGTHTGFVGDVILQLAAIPIVLAAVLGLSASRSFRAFDPLMTAFFVVLAVVVVVQTVPLPDFLKFGGSIQQLVVNGYAYSGSQSTWSPLTAVPVQTKAVILALLPPLAVFFGVLRLGPSDRRRLVNVVLAIGGVSLFLGVVQVLQGEDSPFRFFEITNPSEAVGFFANRNHLAALLVIVAAFATAWVAWSARSLIDRIEMRRSKDHELLGLFVAVVLLLATFLGLALTRSRAGMGLALLAVFGVIVASFVARARANRSKDVSVLRRTLMPVLVLVFLVAFFLGVERFASRFGTDPTEDLRWPFARTTTEQILANLPFGTGLGSFVRVYEAAEKTADMKNVFANRAHNDILEFTLETGVFGVALMLVFLAWVLQRTYVIWSSAVAPGFNAFAARAASLAVFAVLLHSLVDYPLRTTALATQFAFLVGLLAIPPELWGGALAVRERPKRRKKAIREAANPIPVVAGPWPTQPDTRRPEAPQAPVGGNVWPDEWSKGEK